jgi:riboflavin synthase
VFTGLIEARGRIARVERRGRTARLTVEAPFAHELTRGESVAVDGVCLTVAAVRGGRFEADVAPGTMELTTLRGASAGMPVNLERALKLGDRLGGHVVTGHVDGVATVVAVDRTSNGTDVTIELPGPLAKYAAPRGSIAIDGVSLTVAAADGGRCRVSLIPETLAATRAGEYRAGSVVNVEADVLAKYQESIAGGPGGEGGRREEAGSLGDGGLTLERLRELGFTE